MKYTISVLTGVILFFFASCNGNRGSARIRGDWKLVHAEFDTPNLDTSFIATATRTLESSIFFFDEEDQFLIEDTSFTGGSYQGTWSYDAGKRQLRLVYTGLPIDPELYEVLKLNRRKMVIRMELESIGLLEYSLERRE